MDKSLLAKNNNFNATYEKIVLRTQVLKTKNNQYQRLTADQLDGNIMQEINEDKKLLDKQIDQTKKILFEMEQKFREPYQRNKLKEIKKQFEKQTQRYKIIIENLYGKQVIRKRDNSEHFKSMKGSDISSGIGDYFYDNSNSNANVKKYNKSIISRGGQDKGNRKSQLQQQQKSSEMYMEQKFIKQRTEQLGKLEHKFQKIHQIHQQTARIVHYQGQNIDIIGEQLLKAHKNVQGANSQLDSAQMNQKKSKKKYIILIACIILILGTITAVIIIKS